MLLLMLAQVSDPPRQEYKTTTGNWQLLILFCAFMAMCVLISFAHAWRDRKKEDD